MSKKNDILNAVKEVLATYSGMQITLRQIFYKLVSWQILENKVSQYKYLSKILVDARFKGLITFDSMEDRTRSFNIPDTSPYRPKVKSPIDLINEMKSSFDYLLYSKFSYPRWHAQRNFVIVLVEKDTLIYFFKQATEELEVITAACRGYPSLTFLKQLANRLTSLPSFIKHKILLYFGDHDPSGLDIERYIAETLNEKFSIDVTVKRIALTPEQISDYNLLPAPAKKTDSRTKKFIEKHGDRVYELDALDPHVLQNLIRNAVLQYFDNDLYQRILLQAKRKSKIVENLNRRNFLALHIMLLNSFEEYKKLYSYYSKTKEE